MYKQNWVCVEISYYFKRGRYLCKKLLHEDDDNDDDDIISDTLLRAQHETLQTRLQ